MSYCLCCKSSLLRHIRHGEVYLYCPDCRQAMPEGAKSAVRHDCSGLSEVLLRPLVLLDS